MTDQGIEENYHYINLLETNILILKLIIQDLKFIYIN